jgi:DNA-binding response OmpR family regulator
MPNFQNSSMTILVADDQEPNRELLSALLTAEGYRVICAEDGEQALSLIKSQKVDLALLDVVMPRQTGFTVCQIAKSAPETCLIPIVLVTGLDNPDDRLHGVMCGADDFLGKPVNKHELLARVH